LPCAELAGLQVGDKVRHRTSKSAPLGIVQVIEIAPEASSEVVSRQ
jgi:hypothetical protein